MIGPLNLGLLPSTEGHRQRHAYSQTTVSRALLCARTRLVHDGVMPLKQVCDDAS